MSGFVSPVEAVIEKANSILPGVPVESGDDTRWQVIIEIGNFVELEPEPIWEFVRSWGIHEQEDLRNAIGTILLEHLLEFHFDLIFPRVVELVHTNKFFANTFAYCWKFGQSEISENAARFDELQSRFLD